MPEAKKRRTLFGRLGVGFATGFALTVLVAGLGLTLGQPYLLCTYLQEDAFDAAFCGTYERLATYDRKPEVAINWLLAYHGEAPGTQVMMTLAGWTIENPERFLDLLLRLDGSDVEAFSGRLAHAVVQSGQDEAFAAVLKGRQDASGRLAAILEQVEDLRRVMPSEQTLSD